MKEANATQTEPMPFERLPANGQGYHIPRPAAPQNTCDHPRCVLLIVQVPIGENVDTIGAHVHFDPTEDCGAAMASADRAVRDEWRRRVELIEG